MAVSRCPHCDLPLSHEERAGGRCPSCRKSLFAITSEPAPPSDPPWDVATEVPLPTDRPSKRVLPRAGLGWGTLRTGLALFVAGGILLLVSLDLVPFLLARTGDQQSRVLFVIRILTVLGLVSGAVLTLTGVFMGCAVPRASGATVFAVGSSLFVVVLLGLAVVYGVFNLENDAVRTRNLQRQTRLAPHHPPQGPQEIEPWPSEALRAVGFAIRGAGLAATLFFILLLWRVARHLGSEVLAINLFVYWFAHALIDGGLLVLEYIHLFAGGLRALTFEIGVIALVVANLLGIALVVQAFLVRRTISKALLSS